MTATVYIPPYLRHVDTGETVFFHMQMAKNPRMVPHWDMPEDIFAGVSPAEARKAHARAVLAVSKLHITEIALKDINDVRSKQAKNLGFEAEPVEIGADPNTRPKRRAFGRTDNDGGTLRVRGVALEGSKVDPAEIPGDLQLVSESVSSGSVASRRARLTAAASDLAD